jgi:hypothetical protein
MRAAGNSGPKILSDLASEGKELALLSTIQVWIPKAGRGVQLLCLEVPLKTNS